MHDEAPAVAKAPGSHVEMLPPTQALPAGHEEHAEAPAYEYDPLVHGWHEEAPKAANEPALHASALRPPLQEKPAGHGTHMGLDASYAQAPGAHGWLAALPRHGEQVEAPASENVEKGQK